MHSRHMNQNGCSYVLCVRGLLCAATPLPPNTHTHFQVARLSGNEAALLLAGALHTIRLLQVGDVNSGNLGLHAAEAAAFLAARPQAGGEADNDGAVLPRLVLLDWDSADAGCPRRRAALPSPGPNTLASLGGDAAQWHEWRRRRAWSSHRALILLLHANPVARALADKVMAMLDG